MHCLALALICQFLTGCLKCRRVSSTIADVSGERGGAPHGHAGDDEPPHAAPSALFREERRPHGDSREVTAPSGRFPGSPGQCVPTPVFPCETSAE